MGSWNGRIKGSEEQKEGKYGAIEVAQWLRRKEYRDRERELKLRAV